MHDYKRDGRDIKHKNYFTLCVLKLEWGNHHPHIFYISAIIQVVTHTLVHNLIHTTFCFSCEMLKGFEWHACIEMNLCIHLCSLISDVAADPLLDSKIWYLPTLAWFLFPCSSADECALFRSDSCYTSPALTHTHTHWQTQGSRPGQSDESLSHALLDRFVEAGGNFIDTADVYQFGVSESIIGMTLTAHVFMFGLAPHPKAHFTQDMKKPKKISIIPGGGS